MYSDLGSLVKYITTCLVLVSLNQIVVSSVDKCENVDIKLTIDSLLRSESDYKQNGKQKQIAVGFGSCLDVMVPALKLLKSLNVTSPTSTHNFDSINSLEQLKETFAYFFERGASAGRYSTNEEMFKIIFDAILKLGSDVRLGGNAAVMSRRFWKENSSVLLMADVSKPIVSSADINRLHDDIKVAGSEKILENIHVILEYEKGDKWGKYDAPRANRFILYKSSSDTKSSPFEKYLPKVLEFYPDVLVVGGFRGLSQNIYEDGKSGLEHLNNFLSNIPHKIKIHTELSSFPKLEVLRSVLKNAILQSDSLGMNEQELPNLRKVLELELMPSFGHNNPSSIVSESRPCLASVLDNVRNVMKILTKIQLDSSKFLGSFLARNQSSEEILTDVCAAVDKFADECRTNSKPKRLISRLHIHTLAFQTIVTVKSIDSSDRLASDSISSKVKYYLQKWPNSRAAVAKSALTSNRHTCGNESIDSDNSILLFQPNTDHPTSLVCNFKAIRFIPTDSSVCWEEDLKIEGVKRNDKMTLEFCVAPVPVCKKVKQTVGGGDNVSAAGLVPQA